MLITYPNISLYMLISPNNFLVGSLYKIISPIIKITLFLPFWFGWLTPLPCLIPLAGTSRIGLNRSGESRHSCLVSYIKGKIFNLLSECGVTCEHVLYGLYFVEVCSFYTQFVEDFLSWNDVVFFQMFFLNLLEMIIWFLFFILSCWLICRYG